MRNRNQATLEAIVNENNRKFAAMRHIDATDIIASAKYIKSDKNGVNVLRNTALIGAESEGIDLNKTVLTSSVVSGCTLRGFNTSESSIFDLCIEDCLVICSDMSGMCANGLSVFNNNPNSCYPYFSEVDFSGSVFTDCNFVGVTFNNCNFTDCDMRGLKAIGCSFVQCDFSGSNMEGMVVTESFINRSNLTNVSMMGVDASKLRSISDSILSWSSVDVSVLSKVTSDCVVNCRTKIQSSPVYASLVRSIVNYSEVPKFVDKQFFLGLTNENVAKLYGSTVDRSDSGKFFSF